MSLASVLNIYSAWGAGRAEDVALMRPTLHCVSEASASGVQLTVDL